MICSHLTASNVPLDRHRIAVVQLPGEPANVSLIRIGFLGCSPIDPSFALSLDTLEFYHRLRRRHPRLGVQAMTRALCDVHEVRHLILILHIY